LRLLFYAYELLPIYQFVFYSNQVFVDLEDNDQQLSVDPCQQHAHKSQHWTANDSAKRCAKTVLLEGGDDAAEENHNTANDRCGYAYVEQDFDDYRRDHTVKIKEGT
jgi:hypothetical protein